MNPPCAKCKKTVYPVEKLNCLDKVRFGKKSDESGMLASDCCVRVHVCV